MWFSLGLPSETALIEKVASENTHTHTFSRMIARFQTTRDSRSAAVFMMISGSRHMWHGKLCAGSPSSLGLAPRRFGAALRDVKIQVSVWGQASSLQLGWDFWLRSSGVFPETHKK